MINLQAKRENARTFLPTRRKHNDDDDGTNRNPDRANADRVSGGDRDHEKNSGESARRQTGLETASKIDVARPVGLTYCERSRFCGSPLSTRRGLPRGGP